MIKTFSSKGAAALKLCRSVAFRLATITLLITLLLMACSPSPNFSPKTTLTVFAAASLTDAFGEIGTAFEQSNPNVTLRFNFAGSQQLAQQITQGAPADVFASANTAQMEIGIRSGRISPATSHIFAKNRLIVITPRDNKTNITALDGLAKPSLKIVLADKAVPVGQYSLDFLQKASAQAKFGANYGPNVLKNVVSYEQDVKAVLNKVALGEADAGIVYTTDAIGPNAAKIQRIEIADDLNTLANYPIAILNDSKAPATAQQFVDFVSSARAQSILRQYGFLP